MPSGRPWHFTEAQDEVIRQCWMHNKMSSHAAKRAAQIIGCWPDTAIRRATQIGLIYARQRFRWIPAELEVIEQHAHLALDTIQKKLRGISPAGVKRTRAAIAAQIYGQHFRTNLDGMGHPQLAECLGMSKERLKQWREDGRIVADRLPSIGTACGYRKDIVEEHQRWHYRNDAIVRFLFLHPSEIDLRRVNQLWFMTLLEPYISLFRRPPAGTRKTLDQTRIELLERLLAENEQLIARLTKNRIPTTRPLCPTCGRRAPGRPRIAESPSFPIPSSTGPYQGPTQTGSVLDSATVARIRRKALQPVESAHSTPGSAIGARLTRNGAPSAPSNERRRSATSPFTIRSSGSAGGSSAGSRIGSITLLRRGSE